MSKKKTIIFGVDGGTFAVIKPLIEQGKLPNFARFMQEGSYGELESTIHPLTPQAWTSFMTGKNPGKHGIFDFFERKLGSYDFQYSSNATRHCPSIWNLLNNYEKRVGLLNVPFTYPPEQLDDFVIAGWGTPGKESDFIYPAVLKDEIISEFGNYGLLDVDHTDTPDNFVRHQHELVSETVSLSKYLNKKYDLDVFMVVFTGSDALQHFFWHHHDRTHPLHTKEGNEKYGTVVNDIYGRIDWALGELLEFFPSETNFIILSDHGFGAPKKMVYLHKWLEENGLLVFKDTSLTNSVFNKPLATIRQKMKHSLPQEWRFKLRNLFPLLKDKVDSYLSSSEIDWSKTKAFSWGNYGNIIINLQGREPTGIVAPGKEYEKLCDDIKERLYELRDPETQEKVVEKVYCKEELYKGSYIDKSPDLIVVFKDYAYLSIHTTMLERSKKVFEEMDRGGFKNKLKSVSQHKLNGICFLKGEAVNSRVEIQGAKIIDLAPTILYLMGLPIPDDIDGKLLVPAIKAEYLQSKEIKYEADVINVGEAEDNKDIPFSESDNKEIAERLKGLGYLE